MLERFRNLILVTTERITNKASTGQAAYHSMTMDVETQGMVCGIVLNEETLAKSFDRSSRSRISSR